MSQSKTPKKKVVTTRKVTPTSQRVKKTFSSREPQELIFKKQNYLLMGLGAGLIFLGMLLMLGGSMPGPDVWDESLIYSFRRTVLAPVVILAGLVVEVFAIFKRV
jgi:hypothetical protein